MGKSTKLNNMLSYCKGSNAFISFDLETTGIGNPMNHPYLKIIEIGAVKIENNKIVDRFQTFVNPFSKIPNKITNITGISQDMVKNAPDFSEAIKNFKAFAGDLPLIAHNATFDSNFIYYFGDLIGVNFHENPLIDSLVFAKYLWPKEKNSLDYVAERCGILQLDHHRADDDAYVLGEIFISMMEDYLKEDIDNAPMPDLEALKTELPDFKSCNYQICSANYWEKGEFKRIYVTIKTPDMEYIDFFYDLVHRYWSFKNKEQSKKLINFSALNYFFKEYVNNQKKSLLPYIQNM